MEAVDILAANVRVHYHDDDVTLFTVLVPNNQLYTLLRSLKFMLLQRRILIHFLDLLLLRRSLHEDIIAPTVVSKNSFDSFGW
jgi:hypothetical protein